MHLNSALFFFSFVWNCGLSQIQIPEEHQSWNLKSFASKSINFNGGKFNPILSAKNNKKKKKKQPKLPWLWLIHEEKKHTRYFRYKSISIVRTLRINIFLFLLFINLLRTSNRALNSWNLLFTYSESTMRYPQTDKCTRHVCCFSLIVSQPPINLFALLNTSVPIH